MPAAVAAQNGSGSGARTRPPPGHRLPESILNKSLLAAVVLAAGAGHAGAQSSSTVFGIVDVAVRSVSNDDTVLQVANSGLQTSRLGFRAVEDLGGGLSAGFWIEGELQPDTGNTSFNWSRRATVSLVDQLYGEARLGRDKVPTIYEWEDFDPFRDAGIARSTRLSVASGIVPAGGAYSTFSRADNAVSYLLPGNLGGVFGQFSAAPGEGTLGKKYIGGRVGYRSGALVASTSYGTTQVTPDDDATIWNLGGTYDFGPVKLWGFYSTLEIGQGSQDNWLLGLTAPLGLLELRASYEAMDGDGTLDGQKASLLGLGGVYSLSKRTALYATYSRIDNTGTAFTVASGTSLTRGNDSSGFEVGVRHSF
jgi:predicted porin